MYKLRAILCCDNKFGIGKKNDLLFHLPLDMKFFRETTSGHTVAMGENTLISFPNSKPLKNRTNIVLSGDITHNHDRVINVHSLDDFKKEIRNHLEVGDVFIIGGASIYNQMLPYYDEIYLTKVNEDGGAEVFFKNVDEDPSYELIKQGEPLLDNGHEISFCTYKNLNKMPL